MIAASKACYPVAEGKSQASRRLAIPLYKITGCFFEYGSFGNKNKRQKEGSTAGANQLIRKPRGLNAAAKVYTQGSPTGATQPIRKLRGLDATARVYTRHFLAMKVSMQC